MSKIKFDIKYRPEIEAGKYKVKVGKHDARIVCWDCDGDKLVVCVKLDEGVQVLIYDTDGRHRSIFPNVSSPDLELYGEPELTEFEKGIKQCLAFNYGIEFNDDCNEVLKSTCNSILELAQKELENSDWIKDIREWCYNKGHLEGYAKGQEDAEKRHKEATSFHYNLHPAWPPCFSGGPCTNPYHDCINCPRHGTSGIAKTDTNIK